PGACDLFHSRLFFGTGWILCVVWSAFLTSNVWPAISVTMCGEYMQPFWSSSTGVFGASKVRLPRPSLTYTITFARSPEASVTTSSVAPPPGWTLAQNWSAPTLIFFGFAAGPSIFTVQLTEPTVTLLMGVEAGCTVGGYLE